MKQVIADNNRIDNLLDIRFIPTDSPHPTPGPKSFSEQNAKKIREDMNAKIGHLAADINKAGGYINIYTLGNSVIGQPQLVNFSKEVWDKIGHPVGHAGVVDAATSESDYLDHENYNDI